MVGSELLHVDYPNFRLQAFWALSSNGTRFSLVITILPVFQNHLQLHVTLTRTNRRINAFSQMGGGGIIRQKITFILGFIAVSWFRLDSTSYRGSPGSLPLHCVRLVVQKVTLGHAFLSTVPSPLSHTFNKHSIFILISILLLPKGQAGEEWVLSTREILFRKSREL